MSPGKDAVGVEIFCDGSVVGNPGPGGYAALLTRGRKERIVKGRQLTATTSSRMELMAASSAAALAPAGAGLGQAAKELLLEASLDADGQILRFPGLDGTYFQTHGRNFGEDQSARELARWKDALEQLEDAGLIRPVNRRGDVFEVTHSGFELADQIRAGGA